jgi:hypothetical protein
LIMLLGQKWVIWKKSDLPSNKTRNLVSACVFDSSKETRKNK